MLLSGISKMLLAFIALLALYSEIYPQGTDQKEDDLYRKAIKYFYSRNFEIRGTSRPSPISVIFI
jgi:hypothetical protein